MFWIDALFAFLVALLFSALLVGAAGYRYSDRAEPWAAGLLAFVLLFVLVWAGGAWITPVGPAVWGVYWLPFVIVGLLVALLLAAAIPHPPRRPTEPREVPPRTGADLEGEEVAAGVGTALWVLLLIGVVSIVVYYI